MSRSLLPNTTEFVGAYSADNDLPQRTQPGNAALAANTDAQAVSVWLLARASRSTNTFDSYRREARRLLLWTVECNLTLQSLKVEHVHAFYKHLQNPPPHWVRPSKLGREVTPTATQVLTGPCSEKGIDYTRRVLSQMYTYLQDAGYVQRNVFRLSLKRVVPVESPTQRVLDLDAWAWLWDWICSMPRTSSVKLRAAVRARWLFALLYHTGIRREEVANGLMSDFVRTDGQWTLKVMGKGAKIRFVTVNSSLQSELITYRAALCVTGMWPTPVEDHPLLMPYSRKRRTSTMTPRAIGGMVRDITLQAAEACEDEHIKARVTNVTTHWMRHTNATHRMLAGASLLTTQDELGHADLKTTRIYTHTGNVERRADAEKLTLLITSPLNLP